jgi:hypothetical protein
MNTKRTLKILSKVLRIAISDSTIFRQTNQVGQQLSFDEASENLQMVEVSR